MLGKVRSGKTAGRHREEARIVEAIFSDRIHYSWLWAVE